MKFLGTNTIYLRDPTKHYEVKLEIREKINHDTILLRFALPTLNHILGLPVGQHIQVVAKIGESNVIRNYTPVSLDYEYVGYMDLIIKVSSFRYLISNLEKKLILNF